MGAVTVIELSEIEAIPLPLDSWSKMLVNDQTVSNNVASLGYSVFTAGTETDPVKHSTEEFAFVISGSGEIRLDDEAVKFNAGEALHIPQGVWHAVANTGSEDVVMVFGFPCANYPPTERR